MPPIMLAIMTREPVHAQVRVAARINPLARVVRRIRVRLRHYSLHSRVVSSAGLVKINAAMQVVPEHGNHLSALMKHQEQSAPVARFVNNLASQLNDHARMLQRLRAA